jgi:hypothetical protein
MLYSFDTVMLNSQLKRLKLFSTLKTDVQQRKRTYQPWKQLSAAREDLWPSLSLGSAREPIMRTMANVEYGRKRRKEK